MPEQTGKALRDAGNAGDVVGLAHELEQAGVMVAALGDVEDGVTESLEGRGERRHVFAQPAGQLDSAIVEAFDPDPQQRCPQGEGDEPLCGHPSRIIVGRRRTWKQSLEPLALIGSPDQMPVQEPDLIHVQILKGASSVDRSRLLVAVVGVAGIGHWEAEGRPWGQRKSGHAPMRKQRSRFDYFRFTEQAVRLRRVAVDEAMENTAAEELGVRILQQLKQGGQKTVLLVERGSDQYVMKVISTGSSQPDALKRATREVELLSKINHPNVVKVASSLLELGEPPEGVAWLEDFLDGEDLGDAIASRWEWDEVKQMATEIARGLAEMHDIRVVHRDLSANNIRRLAAGGFVVMDPGYARHTGKSQLTAAGQPGTPGFLSPEHLQNYSGAPTAASDVFCVGILMHLALTSDLAIPFTGDLGDYAARLAAVQVTDIKLTRPDLADDAVAVIRRCLHPQPARRYRNGRRLTEALEAL